MPTMPSGAIAPPSPLSFLLPTPTTPPSTSSKALLHLLPTATPPPAAAAAGSQDVRRRFQFQPPPPPLGVGFDVSVSRVVRARDRSQWKLELGVWSQKQQPRRGDEHIRESNQYVVRAPLSDDEPVSGVKRGLDKIPPTPMGLTNKRKRSQSTSEANLDLWKRLPYAEGYPDCNYVDNSILTCYPQSNTTLVQSIWSKLIFNAQYPLFIGSGAIDAYLYRADSETLATSYLGIETARGMFAIRPDDTWWPLNQTSWEEGTNQTWRYYFVVVSNGTTLDGGEVHQPTFRAVQTAAPSTLVSSLSSLLASAAAASASAAAASTTSLSSHPKATSTSTSINLQPLYPGPSLALPSWAIALISILGVLIVLLLIIFSLVWKRRRRLGTGEGASGTEDGEGEGDNGERTPSLFEEREQDEMEEVGGQAGALMERNAIDSTPTPISTPTTTKTPRDSLVSHPGLFNDNRIHQTTGTGPTRRMKQDPTTVGLLSPIDAEIITRAFKEELRRPEDDEEGITGVGGGSNEV